MNGPRRLKDDPTFLAETGVDLGAEAEALAPHDLPRLRRRVLGAVARGAAPRLTPTRGGPGLGQLIALLAVGGTIVGALLAGRGDAGPVAGRERAAHAAPQHEPAAPRASELATAPVVSADEPAAPGAVMIPAAASQPAPAAEAARSVAPRPAPRRRAPPLVARVAPPETPATAAPADDEAGTEAPCCIAQEPPPETNPTAGTPLEKDLLEALAESLRRKTFK